MSGGFSNPIIGGGGGLQYPAIKSPNFVHGVSGWSIDKLGNAEFNSIIVPPSTGGATVFIQSATPAAHATGDLWFDTGNGGRLNQWNGSAWVAFQYGTNAIGSGAITAALIAAHTITAAQIAAGTITATEIAAATITAAKLAAGIIVAGIVDGTTISAGTFHGTDWLANSSGTFFYNGTPAANSLVASIVEGTLSVSDPFGNSALGGITTYSPLIGATYYALRMTQNTPTYPSLMQFTATSQAGPWTSSAAVEFDNLGNVNLVPGGSGQVVAFGSVSAVVSGVPEIWNSMLPLGGTWANTGAGNVGAKYRLNAINRVELEGDISGGAIANGTIIFTLPAGYLPATQQRIPVMVLAGAAAAGALTPHIAINGAGQLALENLPAGTTRITFNGSISLDV